ncbi:MAG: DUF3298 domain-containing protein [Chitinophagales bacterium]|nr:DUF3298 domain-containing protein [Chitinophagales bacterium]
MLKKILLGVSTLSISLIFSACNSASTSEKTTDFDAASKDTLFYDFVDIDTTDAVCLSKFNNCPNAKVSYPIFNTPDTTLNNFLNDEVMKSVLFDTDTSEYTTVNDVIKTYFNENASLRKPGDADDDSQAWRIETAVSVYNKIGKYISLEIYREIYEGGAHPNSSVEYKVYDLLIKKQLKVAELLNLKDSALLKIGEKYFRINNSITDTTSLADAGYFIFGEGDDFEDGPNYGKFHFNSNFAMSKDGVEFQYNSYEIGPYALGAPSFTIPYTDIQPFLKLKIW